MMNRKSRTFLCLASCAWAIQPAVAHAQAIEIRVTNDAGSRLSGTLIEKTGEEEIERPIRNGQLLLDPFECADGTEFYFETNHPLYRGMTSDIPYSCQQPVTDIKVSTIYRVASVGNILTDWSGEVRPIQLAAAAPSAAMRVDELRGELSDSLGALEFAVAARNADDLARLLRAQGQPELANDFEGVALQLGSHSAAFALGVETGGDYIQQTRDGFYVESEDAREVLMQFQQEVGIASNAWDAQTFEEIERATADVRAAF